jgi:hypothetical protein
MIKSLLSSLAALVLITTSGADAAPKKAAAKKEPPPPDYFPLRIKDAKGNPIEWWWKYTYTTYNLNGKPMEPKPADFKLQVISAEEQPDKTVIGNSTPRAQRTRQ